MKHRTILLFVLLPLVASALAAFPAPAAAQSAPTLFRGARVFDGERVLEETDVLVRDGRIVAIANSVDAPAGAVVIDGVGKTLLPGLIDAHTHTFREESLRAALVFGVTTELDMFTDPDFAAAMRTQQRAGEASARADLRSAGVLATAPGGHGTEYGIQIPTISDPDSAQAFIDARVAEGSDWIKIVYDDGHLFGLDWPTISRETLAALIEAAHRRDRLAVVHVSTRAAARDAIEAGADGLAHLFTDSAAGSDFASRVRTAGAFVIPTLVVLKSITGEPGGDPLLDDPRIAPYLSATARTRLSQSFPARPGAEAGYGFAEQTLSALYAAGVPILAGTDASNPGTSHGAALHRELELLVAAGLTPVEALAAATRVPAEAFGLADRGRIVVGGRADLVLVSGDPTADIAATRDIAGVWKGGVRVDREAYREQLAEAAKAAEVPLEALADGLISDFESGEPTAVFGTPWTLTTDSFAGGTSTGELAVVNGGAEGSGTSLRITGTISGAVPYAWSGAMWSPGSQAMQAADLSAKEEVVFFAKGDGGTYRVLVFAQSAGFTPLTQTFVASDAWTEVAVPWSAFGTDGSDVMAVMFVGGPAPGDFAFRVDDMRLR